MKTAMVWLLGSLLAAGPAWAASVTATDGGTAVYGNANGIAIDFDATPAPNAVWTPGLVNGQTYVLNSVAIKNTTTNTGNYYLGVYTGFSGGVLSGFKGVSDSAKDFSTSPNNWLTFTFSCKTTQRPGQLAIRQSRWPIRLVGARKRALQSRLHSSTSLKIPARDRCSGILRGEK